MPRVKLPSGVKSERICAYLLKESLFFSFLKIPFNPPGGTDKQSGAEGGFLKSANFIRIGKIPAINGYFKGTGLSHEGGNHVMISPTRRV